MALITCPDCQKQISDQAVACPGCGAPIAAPVAIQTAPTESVSVTRSGGKWEAAGFILILIGGFIAFTASGGLGSAMMAAGFVIFLVGRFN